MSIGRPEGILRYAQVWALVLLSAICASAALAVNANKTKFWNLTGDTIVKFELAPAGTTNFGPDQCKNDKDDSVDDDERLQIKDIATGSYDARMTFKNGKVCSAKAVNITEGKIFSIETGQLKECTGP
jgi:hypothetical protein